MLLVSLLVASILDTAMSEANSRAAFDRLVTKNHVQFALVQGEDEHNEIPSVNSYESLHVLLRY